RRLDRRALLGGAAAITLPFLLGGCSTKRAQGLKPLPDVAVLTGAITAEEDLVALYEAGRATHADLAGRLDPFLTHPRPHPAALGLHYQPGTATTSPTPSARPRPRPTVPREPERALAALRTAEQRAAADRVRDVARADVGPGLAQLFASIGACESEHAVA